jgi:hypothetical protein
MERIPITILGGSDRKRSRLPDRARGMHPLAAYKGAALRIAGEPLALVLARRLLDSGGFGPVAIAGPSRIFEPLVRELWRPESGPAPVVIDTDSTVAMNLRAAIRHHESHHDGPLGILACDVLPTAVELAELRERFEAARPVALWLPFIQSPPDPDQLGAFAWKPKYRIVPAEPELEGEEPVPILPGHLGILKPARLRLRLLFGLMDAAYRTRNRPVASRRWAMLWRVSGSLLLADLLQLLRLRPPTRTVSVVAAGLRISAALRSKELNAADLERIIADVFLHHEYRRLERPIALPILTTLTLAEDIDTAEEAAAALTEVLDDPELTTPDEDED